MNELLSIEVTPNELEKAIIEWDTHALKKLLLDRNLLLNLGYSLAEIELMQKLYFGIRFPNPDQMNYFEMAVYRDDKRTISNYYRYMLKNPSFMESYGYTENDLDNIRFIHIEGNNRFATNLTGSYGIASRLYIMQKNKNRMAEMYYIKYLKEDPEQKYKEEAINNLVKIYREEEYKAERLADFMRLASVYPQMLEYSQLNRSFYIELLYRDEDRPDRYQRICELGDYYDKQLQICKEKKSKEGLSDDEIKLIEQEEDKYVLENKAMYLYAISMFKNYKNGWEYFIRNRLYELNNVTLMRELLEVGGDYLKIYLKHNIKSDAGIYYSDILQIMAQKAKSQKGDGNYSFLLYLNQTFGARYGMDWDSLEKLYLNADLEGKPFEYGGYGGYLYALAEEYRRIHGKLEGFPYLEDFLRLKKEFYGYYVVNIEKHLMNGCDDVDTIRQKISLMNKCIRDGDRKLLREGEIKKINFLPRYLFFFPGQDQELNDKFEKVIQNDIKLAKDNNSSKNMLKNLRLSLLPNPEDYLDESNDELLTEISYYSWKKIQYNFDESKDQLLLLAKIYEYYMNRYRLLSKIEAEEEKINEYQKLFEEYLNKVAYALRSRAELAFEYDDWYDLYQYYIMQAAHAFTENEKLPWVRLAYELYLDIAYKIKNDPDQVGKHFTGLRDYFADKKYKINFFELCITAYKDIAALYIEELAGLYNKYHQYRYLKFAFEITKVTKDYKLYFRNFRQALIQWEMVRLISNIHYLLLTEEYELAEEYYDYCVSCLNNIPDVLRLTKRLISNLKTGKKPINYNISNMLHLYPNISKRHYVVKSRYGDERAMLDNIEVLRLVIDYYTGTKELTGGIDCSSIRYALYLQYNQLYSETMDENYLKLMLEALIESGAEKEYLPSLYKAITLCYRHEQLKVYSETIIEKMHLSTPNAAKLEEYSQQLMKLKDDFSAHGRVFEELCDLTINCTNDSIGMTIKAIKAFIRKYIFSGMYEMTDELASYLMSFDIIDKVWLQLYYEQDEAPISRPLSAFAEKFYHVGRLLSIMEDGGSALLNEELVKKCIYSPSDYDELGMDNPYVMLVQDYLDRKSTTSYEGAEILHHFFASMERDDGPALYEVIDTINAASDYKNRQCITLFEQLYRETGNYGYLTGLARQYAKSRNYSMAESCYKMILASTEENPEIAKRYSYVRIHALAITLLIKANNNESIRISSMDVTAKQICEIMAYLSDKYANELDRVMPLLSDEEEKKLFDYISRLMAYEKSLKNIKNKDKRDNNNKTDTEPDLETQEKTLFEKLLALHGTVYFNLLLPNLYQRSQNPDFKYYIESCREYDIKSILREANNKPILVLNGQRMAPGQKLVYIDYERQERNVGVSIGFFEEMQDTPLLQELVNRSGEKNPVPIYEAFYLLDRENDKDRRKDILLDILSYQPDNPEDIERDEELKKRLPLARAELGYLVFLEEYDKNFNLSLQAIHEAIICLPKNKADSRMLLEDIRDCYLRLLIKIPDFTMHEASKLFAGLMFDINQILKILDNDNNNKNVFLEKMLYVISRLQPYSGLGDKNSYIETLETIIVELDSLKKEDQAIKRITRRWKSWLYRELIRLVNQDTILDVKYYIDRRESSISLYDLYQRLLTSSSNINVYGPKGVGVSSLLLQCYRQFSKEALENGHLFLYVDIKQIISYYDEKDEFGFGKRILELLRQDIRGAFGLGPDMETELLSGTEIAGNLLDFLKILKIKRNIEQMHLFLDNYGELNEKAKGKVDLMLQSISYLGISCVVGSEAAIADEIVEFAEKIEMTGLSENETMAYINNRLKYEEGLPKTYPLDKLYKLTGGIPVLLRYIVEYMMENKSFTDIDLSALLMNKAGALFERWDSLWRDKFNQEDNKVYHWYLQFKFQTISKEIFVHNNNLYGQQSIDLESYQRSMKWTQEEEVDPEKYGIAEEIWDMIKNQKEVYRYIKYGEALKNNLLMKLRPEERIKDYDYSPFALNYCLAFEMLCDKVLKGFLVKKIPDYNCEKLNKEGISTLKDTRDDTKYFLGDYRFFLIFYNKRYYNELRYSRIGFNMRDFIDDFKEAKNIRNTVAHAGNSLGEDMLQRFLILLFGSKESRGKRMPIFEGICRLIKVNG